MVAILEAMSEHIPLLETYLKDYKSDPEKFIETLGNTVVPKKVINALYEMFVYRKELEPIESLPKEEKTRIWKITEGLSYDDRIMLSHSIYLIENITK